MTLGLTFGAAYGGKAISLGRRNALLLSNVIGLVGLCLSSFEIFNLILLGRFIFGFASGLQSVICPRFYEETVPNRLFSRIMPTFNFFQSIGVMFSFFLAEILPADDDI